MAANHVVLLRGINVGGHHRLPMKDLRRMAEDLGVEEVSTIIQSGNLVFSASKAAAAKFRADLAKAIKSEFGFESPVVLRSAAEMTKAVASNPFFAEGCVPDHLHYMFLASKPARGDVAALDPDRSPPDRFVVRGKEIFVHCPNGLARTKLSNAYFDAKLKTISTSRNSKTVAKIIDLLG